MKIKETCHTNRTKVETMTHGKSVSTKEDFTCKLTTMQYYLGKHKIYKHFLEILQNLGFKIQQYFEVSFKFFLQILFKFLFFSMFTASLLFILTEKGTDPRIVFGKVELMDLIFFFLNHFYAIFSSIQGWLHKKIKQISRTATFISKPSEEHPNIQRSNLIITSPTQDQQKLKKGSLMTL